MIEINEIHPNLLAATTALGHAFRRAMRQGRRSADLAGLLLEYKDHARVLLADRASLRAVQEIASDAQLLAELNTADPHGKLRVFTSALGKGRETRLESFDSKPTKPE